MRRLRKLQLVLASAGTVLLLWGVLFVGLTLLSRWGERNWNSYPWVQEDSLRYLLPSLQEARGLPRILLAGPSESREGFVYQRFKEAFPEMDVFQGGLMWGTLDDLLLALDYIDQVYGPGARPHTLVVGITPRFVSNIAKEQSPFLAAINRYSPYYSAERTEEGSRLEAKNIWRGLLGRVHFLSKQQDRYFTAILALLNHVANDSVPYPKYEEEYFAKIPRPRTFVSMLLNSVQLFELPAALGRWSSTFISPYRYHYKVPRSLKVMQRMLEDPNSVWHKVYAWQPTDQAILPQLDRLRRLADRWNMNLYVVNLPEHSLSQAAYRSGQYERYLRLVQASLGDTPFLNLRDMFPADDFYDVGHLRLPAAVRMTDCVIVFLQTHSGRNLVSNHTVGSAEPEGGRFRTNFSYRETALCSMMR